MLSNCIYHFPLVHSNPQNSPVSQVERDSHVTQFHCVTEMTVSYGFLKRFCFLGSYCPSSLKFPSASFSLEHRRGAGSGAAFWPRGQKPHAMDGRLEGMWVFTGFLKPRQLLGPDLLWTSWDGKENQLHLDYHPCSWVLIIRDGTLSLGDRQVARREGKTILQQWRQGWEGQGEQPWGSCLLDPCGTQTAPVNSV